MKSIRADGMRVKLILPLTWFPAPDAAPPVSSAGWSALSQIDALRHCSAAAYRLVLSKGTYSLAMPQGLGEGSARSDMNDEDLFALMSAFGWLDGQHAFAPRADHLSRATYKILVGWELFGNSGHLDDDRGEP